MQEHALLVLYSEVSLTQLQFQTLKDLCSFLPARLDVEQNLSLHPCFLMLSSARTDSAWSSRLMTLSKIKDESLTPRVPGWRIPPCNLRGFHA